MTSVLQELHDRGQSIWLDSVSRELLDGGTLARYIRELSVTGLTSNPTIFERALSSTSAYDDVLRERSARELAPEKLFFELALRDITDAADLLRPAHDASDGVDGFASLEVSPTLADDADTSVAEAKTLHGRARRPNVLIKVPGTPAGCGAIEALIASGVPINVTLLFSEEHYGAAAEAYLRGIERRVERGLDPHVASVASLFVSRWDAHTASTLPPELTNRLGVAIGQRVYRAYRDLLESPRWRKLEAAGARPQRLLFASTGTKDPALPAGYYVTALAAEGTINTMPEKTLLAFSERGELGNLLDTDTSEADRVIAEITRAGVDLRRLAATLQTEGRDLFVASWNQLLERVEARRRAIQAA